MMFKTLLPNIAKVIVLCNFLCSFTLFAQGNTPPNVLFIVADDLGIDALQSSDYGITSANQPNTPNINALRDSGVSFLNTWATPQCATTRAAAMSGKYGINTGVRQVPGNLDLVHQSIFNHLNENSSTDYAKAVIGKWHISNPEDANHPFAHGVDHYEGILNAFVSDYYSWEKVDENGAIAQIDEYITSHFTNAAQTWISNQTKPWFLWLAHVAPHSPFHVPPSGTFTQNNVNNNRGRYLAAIENLDYEIGELLNSMDQATIDNTIIIFVGDNGTPNGVSRFFPAGHGKASVYEGGLRVPMIITGKGVSRQGEFESGLAQVTDIYATLIELLSNDLEGGIHNSYSLAPALTAQNAITRPYIYSDYRDEGVEFWAIRNATYKLIENENGLVEFYNVINDLEEVNNLVAFLTNEEASILSQLQAEAAAIRSGWSCADTILNGTEVTVDDCSTCSTDELSFSNIGCCETPNAPTIFYEYLENSFRKIYTNNYPNHDFCYSNPRSIPTQSYHDLEMDVNPVIANTTTSVINQRTGRPATTFGVALNGVLFAPGPALPFVYSNPNTGEFNWDWVFEPTNNQGAGQDKVSLDCASAHTSTAHGYHYHGEMFSYLENEIPGITSARAVNEIIHIGWAADGFPILYKFGPDATGAIKQLQPSYKLKEGDRPGDGTDAPCGPHTGRYTNDYEFISGVGDLDACNGMDATVTVETANGLQTFDYFYVISSTFPQVPRCFVGTPNASFSNNQITGTDNDGDGFIAAFDCNDDNPNVNPLAAEIEGNSIDENCDGSTLSTDTFVTPEVSILPNPSTTKIRLITNFGFNYTVTLYDMQGKQVLQLNNSPEFINIANYNNGVYLLQITNTSTNFKGVYKIVKQ